MKLWNNNDTINKQIEQFTIGQDTILDLELARYDVIGSMAHARMLHAIGILSEQELNELIEGLQLITESIESGTFKIEDGVEDVHSQVEKQLTETVGEAGKKLHTARSRNDQVLVDLKLYFRSKLTDLNRKLRLLINAFITKSKETEEDLMPGFTHMQVGMVSSFGMWFGCYAEALVDDSNMLTMTRKLINQNPLGSGAGYGSSFAIDREMTTRLLEFDDMCYNSMYAQFGRGKTELQVAQAMSNLAFTISKFAYDVCLFSNQNYDLLKLPEAFTTGSSIMPQKKNPDIFELIRGRCNLIQSLPTQISMLIQNLSSGYHRDFQHLKELLFPAFATMDTILDMLILVIPDIEVKKGALDDEKYNELYAVDNMAAHIKEGMSMREAYFKVKEQIADGSYTPKKDTDYTHIGSIGNLGTDRILGKLME